MSLGRLQLGISPRLRSLLLYLVLSCRASSRTTRSTGQVVTQSRTNPVEGLLDFWSLSDSEEVIDDGEPSDRVELTLIRQNYTDKTGLI